MMLRGLMKPMYPLGTSLDAQMVFNFRMKIKSLLKNGVIDVNSMSVTEAQERSLLAEDDLEMTESPEFYTDIFRCCHQLLRENLHDMNELNNIVTYLNSLKAKDPTFDYRVGRADDGRITGFVIQTGIMRRDFELYGGTLCVNRLGRSLNHQGWPYLTTAMLDSEGRACLASEAITVRS